MFTRSVRSGSLRAHVFLWALIAAIGWNYLYDARLQGGLTAKHPPGYYGLLAEALVAGQVHLKLIPDPKLLRLADPYAGPQGADRPHDMSFYRGRFYVYYGITPALVLGVPWLLLTGSYLTEIAITAIFCFAGFLLSAVWCLSVWRRYFPRGSAGWIALCIALLGLASPIFFLSNNPTFYAVPIAAAFFSLMLAGTFVTLAFRAKRLDAVTLWLGSASLCLGLAVGGRPNYVLCLPILAVTTVALWRSLPGHWRDHRTARYLAVATIGPAALVGLGLAVYNYLRFDSPFDFGIRYSMSTVDVRSLQLMGFEFYPKNFRLYLLHAVDFVRYFPFIYAGDSPFGALPHLPWTAAALLFPVTWFSPRLRRDSAWMTGGLFFLGAALVNLAVLCLFFGGVDRYLVDFVPAALLVACIVLIALIAATADWPRWGRLAVRGAVLAITLWTLLNGVFIALSRRTPSPLLAAIERGANRLVYGIEQIGGASHGPVRFTVRFPTDRIGQREPLLSTGNYAGTGDIIFVNYVDSGHVRFGFFHLGLGGPIGDTIPVDYTQDHEVTVSLGSLYPPRQHPLFDRWSETEVGKIRRRLEVTLDGQTVLTASVNVYPSTPDGLQIGANSLAPDVTAPRFTGQIKATARLGAQKPILPAVWPTGPVRLKLRFPPTPGGPPVPLVSTGISGLGDLFSMQIMDDGRVRFIHDSWGSSDFTSAPVEFENLPIHTVDVEMGSLYDAAEPNTPPALRRRLGVWLDGKVIVDVERPFNPAHPSTVEFGFNAIQASTAVGMFTGSILGHERIAPQPAQSAAELWGAIALHALLPRDANGLVEPLVTTGATGAADVVFVEYLDATRVRFGLDHWGKRIDFGPPVDVDYSKPLQLTVSAGSLFPPVDHPAWETRPADLKNRLKNRVEVRLGDKVVLQADQNTYDSRPNQVAIGRNDINASSCRRVFSGQILTQARLPW
jgi:hypothetical protein